MIQHEYARNIAYMGWPRTRMRPGGREAGRYIQRWDGN